MKRQLTEEQARARDERRARARNIAKAVSAMGDADRVMLAAKYGFRNIQGGEYSAYNTCLLAMQCAGGSVFAGFRQWLGAGRAVIKGQHGHCIWVPIGRKAAEAVAPIPEGLEAGEARPGFILGTVFDISQTAEIETGRADVLAIAAEAPAALMEVAA